MAEADRTILIKVTWCNSLPMLLAIFENGNAKGRAYAQAELGRMATAADIAVGADQVMTAEGAAERATVLAALRFYQAAGMGDPDNRSDDIHDIATDGGNVISLNADAIDALCDRLNSGEVIERERPDAAQRHQAEQDAISSRY